MWLLTNPYENPSYRFENAIYIPENKSNPENTLGHKKSHSKIWGSNISVQQCKRNIILQSKE